MARKPKKKVENKRSGKTNALLAAARSPELRQRVVPDKTKFSKARDRKSPTEADD